MRKLVLFLITFFAVVTFIRALASSDLYSGNPGLSRGALEFGETN